MSAAMATSGMNGLGTLGRQHYGLPDDLPDVVIPGGRVVNYPANNFTTLQTTSTSVSNTSATGIVTMAGGGGNNGLMMTLPAGGIANVNFPDQGQTVSSSGNSTQANTAANTLLMSGVAPGAAAGYSVNTLGPMSNLNPVSTMGTMGSNGANAVTMNVRMGHPMMMSQTGSVVMMDNGQMAAFLSGQPQQQQQQQQGKLGKA
ncbi:unnamed protein product [Protopolystoma xenopodis]|uniref:Uncharacterized protein n=1 Tax=Protopolystoma xenopodis TaxID=117903 RepID=A0A448X438_9PLAT|nr:unnamed protein product [Protopolystoma xenopodis]